MLGRTHLGLTVLVLATTPVSGVLPRPQQQTDSGDVFSLGEEFEFLAVGVHSTPMLQNAFDRYRTIIFQRRKLDGAAPALSTITGCDVNVTSDVQVKTLTTDEAYELHQGRSLFGGVSPFKRIGGWRVSCGIECPRRQAQASHR